jgi:Na+-transporting NADH:ubiquinone oxidoreductase subunit B
VFQKQAVMRRVLYSLVPIYLWSLFLFGWRVLALSVVVFGLGIMSEFMMEKARKKKVSEAVLVTCALLTLSLPPGVPLWIAAIASVFAVVMGKGVYGGFGRNIFNPAITGRIFTYISFPLLMQTTWMIPGGFGTLGISSIARPSTPLEAVFVIIVVLSVFFVVIKNYEKKNLVLWTIFAALIITPILYVAASYGGIMGIEIDAVTTVTPLQFYRGTSGEGIPEQFAYLRENTLLNLFLGRRVGSIGETSILLISLAGIYLLVTKTANWRMIFSTLFAAALLTGSFYFTGILSQLSPAMSPDGKTLTEGLIIITKMMFSGSLMFVAVFMSTDPISAPNKPSAQFIYGFIIGIVTVLVRTFSGFPEGTSFGILMANTFASLLDEVMPAPKKKAKVAPATSTT